MIIKEYSVESPDLNTDCSIVHLTGSDCVANSILDTEVEIKLNVKDRLLKLPFSERVHPGCKRIGNIYTLFVKNRHFEVAVYSSLLMALEKLKQQLAWDGINEISIVITNNSINGLRLSGIKILLERVFGDSEISINLILIEIERKFRKKTTS